MIVTSIVTVFEALRSFQRAADNVRATDAQRKEKAYVWLPKLLHTLPNTHAAINNL